MQSMKQPMAQIAVIGPVQAAGHARLRVRMGTLIRFRELLSRFSTTSVAKRGRAEDFTLNDAGMRRSPGWTWTQGDRRPQRPGFVKMLHGLKFPDWETQKP